MLLQAILLFIAVPVSLAEETPLIQSLPEEQFSASSSYNDTFKAANVRFSTQEPWCHAATGDDEYDTNGQPKEYVTVDLGCPRTVGSVEGKNPHLGMYSSEYSNNNKTWTKLATNDTTPTSHYAEVFESFEGNFKVELAPPVRARFFRFRISHHTATLPCLKAELYAKQGPEDSVQPMGCFTEKFKKPLIPVVYHKVKSINKKFPDILAIYKECQQKAADKSLEIFGIMNKKCIKFHESGKAERYFKNAGRSDKCKECFGKGIGDRKTAIFVYKIIKEK